MNVNNDACPLSTSPLFLEITQQYAWQFGGNPRISIPEHWLTILRPLFQYVDELIKDDVDRMLFSWIDIKVHKQQLVVYYLSQEEQELAIDPIIDELRQACHQAGLEQA
ncbi:hypothetical protein [Alcaligenes endophyticus]|uniref:DUF3630 family protein n=1 Tax=Alcaligenes endophyticus TaxID=1929088 RepID=A0ABT8EEE0_9BURK|nr:hypothetical protein [Alcaligenes endophyticus]MCX5592219.1 hypothetical protein [Alcaligenes endophyticus]MDN4119661.1 hypothetical protein [Alcaligenes endophyticus]